MTFEQAYERFKQGHFDLETSVALIKGVKAMQEDIARMRKELSDYGWIVNPDRMGG